MSLDDFVGRPVVLVFYPGDDSPVCTRQLVSYTLEFPSFETVGARLLAVSPQDVDSHDRFAAGQGGFAFPLLADVDKAVGRMLLDGALPLTDHLLLVSGRVSYEIVHKALTAGVAGIVRAGRPTPESDRISRPQSGS